MKNDDSGFKKEYAVSIIIKPMLGKTCEIGGIPVLKKKLKVHLAFNVINLTSVLIRVVFFYSRYCMETSVRVKSESFLEI